MNVVCQAKASDFFLANPVYTPCGINSEPSKFWLKIQVNDDGYSRAVIAMYSRLYTPLKTNMTIEKKTHPWMNEDVSPIKNCDFPASHVSIRVCTRKMTSSFLSFKKHQQYGQVSNILASEYVGWNHTAIYSTVFLVVLTLKHSSQIGFISFNCRGEKKILSKTTIQ